LAHVTNPSNFIGRDALILAAILKMDAGDVDVAHDVTVLIKEAPEFNVGVFFEIFTI
jgi:hypothetical protein